MRYFIKFLNQLNKIAILAVFVLSTLFVFNTVHAQSTTPTPSITTTPELCSKPNEFLKYPPKNSEECVELESGVQKISLFPFLPAIGLDEFITSLANILLAFLIIFFAAKIVLSIVKWIKDTSGDKGRKEALKNIGEGVGGVCIGFLAYFIVLFIKGILLGDNQLVQCANLYFSDTYAYSENYFKLNYIPTVQPPAVPAPTPNDTRLGYLHARPEFRRCVVLAGKNEAMAQKSAAFANDVLSKCKQYFDHQYALDNRLYTYPMKISDRSALNKCFTDVLKDLRI